MIMFALLNALFWEDGMKKFKCQMCGNCCNMHGYVRLEDGEVDTIAELLGISTSDFISEYTEMMPDRSGLTLAEFSDGRCVFLKTDNSCKINAVKPQQCKDFPEKWRYPIGDETCPACNPLPDESSIEEEKAENA